MNKLVEWSRLYKTKANSKDKPARPDTAILFPPTDTTRAGFLLNAMGCETLGGRTQYFNLPEVEMADGLPRTAVNHLIAWIRRCTSLWQQLQDMGYQTTCKAFTPREVRAIVDQLDEL